MSQKTLRLPVRHYRALPIDRAGHEAELIEIPSGQVALVGMHCWNIGCPDGPAVNMDFCVGMGWPQAAAEAWRIMHEVIRPAMEACRRAGIAVCHVETDWMDAQYPQLPSRRSPPAPYTPPRTLAGKMAERAHGPDYLRRSPLAQMKRAALVSPVGDEPLFFYTDQLHEYLQERGISTLIYVGFATDMCVLGADGGARPMLGLGYRCVLMRDATVGVETPQSFPERLATRYGTHLFEWQVGFSTTFAEFVTALGDG
ncbi:MAG: cysteine hydrolase family protein [Candidatus Latescibacteria bacterium]|nr:cysteine hydrolase family protein [Candidatus Latescibacterota bacterium]